MRGTSDQQIESLVTLTPEDLVPHEHPIRRIKRLADRVLQAPADDAESNRDLADRDQEHKTRQSRPPPSLAEGSLAIPQLLEPLPMAVRSVRISHRCPQPLLTEMKRSVMVARQLLPRRCSLRI